MALEALEHQHIHASSCIAAKNSPLETRLAPSFALATLRGEIPRLAPGSLNLGQSLTVALASQTQTVATVALPALLCVSRAPAGKAPAPATFVGKGDQPGYAATLRKPGLGHRESLERTLAGAPAGSGRSRCQRAAKGLPTSAAT